MSDTRFGVRVRPTMVGVPVRMARPAMREPQECHPEKPDSTD